MLSAPGKYVRPMRVFSRISDEDLRDLARWWSVLKWPVAPEQLDVMTERRGWKLLGRRKSGGARWDTHLMEFRPWASSSVVGGTVATVTVPTVSAGETRDQETARGVRDAFVDQVAVLREVLGPPTTRDPGATSSVEWALTNESTLWLGGADGLCDLVVTSPGFVEIERRSR